MKINVALILSIILAVGLVAFGFTAFQIYSERQKLNNELELNTIRLSEEFYTNYLHKLELGDTTQIKLSDATISRYNFLGVAIYYNADSIKTFNKETLQYLEHSTDYIAQAIAADSSISN